jgi:hypothetical protein
MMPISQGLLHLFVLALPVACIAWTVTHEDLVREPREYCTRRSRAAKNIFVKKFFYVFTCDYCFSHWVVLVTLLVTGFRLLYDDWRGYVVSGFALVWIANYYMSLFGRLRLGIRSERAEASLKEELRTQVADQAEDSDQTEDTPKRDHTKTTPLRGLRR